MAKIDDLKKKYDITLPVIDFLNTFCPEGKPKYLELLSRLVQKSIDDESKFDPFREKLSTLYNIHIDKLSNFSSYQCYQIFRTIGNLLTEKEAKEFVLFCEYNERGWVRDKDVQNYRDFKDIIKATKDGKLKAAEKDLENQTIKILENDEWLIVRPLTYKSSLKYGANTRWCTASRDDKDSFKVYTRDGILVYLINKTLNVKFAAHRDIPTAHTTFYDNVDNDCESFDLDIPHDIWGVLKDEFKLRPKPNHEYLGDEYKRLEDDEDEEYFEEDEEYVDEDEIETPDEKQYGLAEVNLNELIESLYNSNSSFFSSPFGADMSKLFDDLKYS